MPARRSLLNWARGLRGWAASAVVHGVALTVLASVTVWTSDDRPPEVLLVAATPAEEIPVQSPPARIESGEPRPSAPLPEAESPGLPAPVMDRVEKKKNAKPDRPAPRLDRIAPENLARPLTAATFSSGGGLAGRTPRRRAALVEEFGGTAASESAVERGLAWIAAHGKRSGAWRFDHRDGPCGGRCRNPGTEGSITAATGLAILAFLGAGHTHREGPHRELIGRGIYYLGHRALMTPHGADLQQGTMYAQGIATIALCEAYGMTGDDDLKITAQRALDFIVAAQNRQTGGWRYVPGSPGDTTVLGWQLMALKSGYLARLRVPSPVVYRAMKYLDSVQADGGAFYGYQAPEKQPTTTAVGLLCRMIAGWERDRPALVRGIAYLASQGPSTDNMYYNYYATQIMRHHGGSEWKKWNEQMREHLVATQSRQGHEAGSWYFDGGHARPGGRLYNTAMAVMTLEVYYRYLSLYGDKSTGSF